MSWQLKYSKQAQKDSIKIASTGLKGKVSKLLEILTENPYQSPPSFEKLKGISFPVFSRRIISLLSLWVKHLQFLIYTTVLL